MSAVFAERFPIPPLEYGVVAVDDFRAFSSSGETFFAPFLLGSDFAK